MMENTATYIHFFVSEKTICAPTFIHSAHNKLIHFASPVCFYTAPLLTLSELRLSSLYLRLSFVYICLSFLYSYLSLCLVPTFIHSVHKLLPSTWALFFCTLVIAVRVCLSLSSLYAWLPFAGVPLFSLSVLPSFLPRTIPRASFDLSRSYPDSVWMQQSTTAVVVDYDSYHLMR